MSTMRTPSKAVAGRIPDVVRDRNPGRQLLVAANNAWFAVGPALVFAAGRYTRPF